MEYRSTPGLNRLRGFVERPETTLATTVAAVTLGLIVTYLQVTGARILSVRHAVLPVVWLGASVWLVGYLRRQAGAPNRRGLGLVVAAAYLVVLAIVAGLVGPGSGGGLHVTLATPGWGPMVVYGGSLASVVLVPFEAVGYLALAYAVYRAAARASRATVAGALGLFGCVGCSVPVVAGLAGLGGTSLAAMDPGAYSYDLATVVFVATVLLLVVAVPTGEECGDCGDDPRSDA